MKTNFWNLEQDWKKNGRRKMMKIHLNNLENPEYGDQYLPETWNGNLVIQKELSTFWNCGTFQLLKFQKFETSTILKFRNLAT